MAIQVPIQDFWEEAGAGRCKQGNTEGGARPSLSSKTQWWTATGHCMHSKSAYLLLPRSRKKGMQQRPSKLQSSGCMGFLFTFLPCVMRSAVIATV